MAKVYDRILGEKLEHLIARTKPAQRGVETMAKLILSEAEVNLAAVRMDPRYIGSHNVRLYISTDRLDRIVNMDDPPEGPVSGFPATPGAAMSIEYGHRLGPRSKGDNRPRIEGKWIMHDAAGIPRAPLW